MGRDVFRCGGTRSLIQGSLAAFEHYITTLPASAEFSIAVAAAGAEPPLSVFERTRGDGNPVSQIVEVRRGDLHITGSLRGGERAFLVDAISTLVVREPPPVSAELRLVAGLALATTVATNEVLGPQFVGGAFFGARIDPEGFHWQPDVLYVFYVPGHEREPAFESSAMRPRRDLVACRVVDDVCVAASTINGRIVVPGHEHEMTTWSAQWADRLRELGVSQPNFVAFIPQGVPGEVVIAANDGGWLRMDGQQLLMLSGVQEILNRPPEGNRFGLRFLT